MVPVSLQEFELIRVWDSLVFEDDCEDEFALSLTATGTLDENQTRKALYLVSNCNFLLGTVFSPNWFNQPLQLKPQFQTKDRTLVDRFVRGPFDQATCHRERDWPIAIYGAGAPCRFGRPSRSCCWGTCGAEGQETSERAAGGRL